tara:strand:- start:1896 stop:2639 length:744 start_codon:yes stop_codon:yes gene_type:complete
LSNNSEKIFVFDFDGVICDSTKECLINSFNSYNIYINKNFKLAKSIDEIDVKLIEDFKVFRPYIKGAKEYLKFFDYYFFKKKNLSIEDFHQYKNNTLDYDRFSEIFYYQRENLKKNDFNLWISYNYVFNDIINFLNSLDFYFIATLKDKKSVIDILKFHNINFFEEKILDFKIIKTKHEALNMIINNYGYNKDDLIFIDDNAFHLLDPKTNGYQVYLSNWADLNNDIHIKIANDNSIDIINNINYFK